MNQDINRYIKQFVWTGFYGTDEIAEILIQDIFDQAPLDPHEVEAAIHAEFARKHAAEAEWPAQTDCDKLTQVFSELNDMGIIALENAGYTQSDGLSDITEVYHQMGRADSPIFGYCFYHGQDLESVVQGHGLNLTFGDILGTDEKGIEVGEMIVDKLQQAGLLVEWNGTIKTRIYLPKVAWLRRGGRS